MAPNNATQDSIRRLPTDLLPVLDSAVILGSESHGTHCHSFVLSTILGVLKWRLLFDERSSLTTGHSPSTGGVTLLAVTLSHSYSRPDSECRLRESELLCNWQLCQSVRLGGLVFSLYNFGSDRTENTAAKNSSIDACLFFVARMLFRLRHLAMAATIPYNILAFSRHVTIFYPRRETVS
jgi:hypothetical protein